MSKKCIYKITINNWEKYNGTIKKSHKKIMISTKFLDDAKIRSLSAVTKLLYLSCLLVAGESTSSQIEVSHESLVYHSGVKSGSIESQLTLLQSLQLVSYEKIEPLILNERKRKEEKGKEEKGITRTPEIEQSDNRKIWETYFNAYRLRYGVEPVRNATINSQVSSLRKKLGTEEACKVAEFYLKHNDSWYIKNTHGFGFLLKNAETLRTQMLRNKPITQNEIRRFEKSNTTIDMIEEAKKGGF